MYALKPLRTWRHRKPSLNAPMAGRLLTSSEVAMIAAAAVMSFLDQQQEQ